ncbi:SMI1/KNR4 family protein [Collimonas pratensis]|uniref:SMI1 / KNR4 family protein n=1 Tax=Collimonas pratensis TaxID=279113 RepID=A0ABM5ZAH2_9BURK|nr:SMI1/KNR4 family protein [Collimonas pratensis]AMP16084.1 SMI1 / KNR4 family protein [Collimonas pratensis]
MPIKYRPGATPDAINELELHIANPLPDDYKDFLISHNGLTIEYPGYCDIPSNKVESGSIAFGGLFGTRINESSMDLISFNQEFISEIDFLGKSIAIGEDGGGNPFVLMLEPRSGQVLYWDRTHLHEPDDGYQADFPEVDDCGDLYVISDSFSDFLVAIQQHTV